MKTFYDSTYKKKKPLPHVVTLEYLYRISEQLNDTESKALFYALYLTGARISELLETERKDYHVENYRGYKVMYVDLITLKRKQKMIRSVPIMLDYSRTDEELKMADLLWKYIITMKPDQSPFPFVRKTAWKKIRTPISVRAVSPNGEYLKNHEFLIHPHYLRHCRLTHLVQYYRYDTSYLKKITGWTNDTPAKVYVQLDTTALIDRILERQLMEVVTKDGSK